jgi:alkylation response protein AidB-like acyl-CoA dehydrogenase
VRFSLSPEQEMLADSAGQWAREQAENGVVRAAVAGKPVPVDDLWARLGDLGWLGIAVPEEAGGSGGSLIDACLVVEALSRHLVPIPYAGNAVIAVAGLRLLGTEGSLLAEIAAGTRRCSVVLAEDLAWPPSSGTGVAWDWTDGDTLLVLGDAGLGPASGVEASASPSVDLTRSLGRATGLSPGRAPSGGEAAETFVAWARVATGAVLLGAMDGAFRAAVDYARGRHQFGRAIGSFQAVQHLCAEMLVDVEAARSALYGAAWAVEHASPAEAARAASVAKIWCGAAAVRVCETAMQVHGGIGMTWECDAHLHGRACHLARAAFGTELADLDVVAQALFGAQGGAR